MKPVILISKCIEHDHCRYDGSMIGSDFVKALKPFVDFVTVCPEVAIGLTIPREAIRLAGKEDIRLIGSMKGEDVTDKMLNFRSNFVSNLKEIHGAILKSKSPSCGTQPVKVYPSHGKVVALDKKSEGMFGGYIKEQYPNLPIEDEGRLKNYNIRHHFLTRLFAYTRFKNLDKSVKALQDFHKNHKYLLMMFDQQTLKKMGNLIGTQDGDEIILYNSYEELLLKAMKEPASKGRVENTLLHVFGYFKNELSSDEKTYFLDLLEEYKMDRLPYLGLLTVLRSWVIKYKQTYLEEQILFLPYPKDILKMMDSGKGRV